jgi:Tfp pilus assembly protein PilP
VKGHGLAAGWIATLIVLIAALGGMIMQSISLGRSGASADDERLALVRQLESSRQRMQEVLSAKLDVMKELRWNAERQTAPDVLRRLADLARDGHAKVSAVSPVDKESGARSRESSHRVEMMASFHEVVDFATRIERDGGLLEDVVLETPQAKPGEESAVDGLSAQFRLTTVEPSDDARQIMRRVLAASTKNPKFSLATLALPVEPQVRATPELRDPFRFAEAPARRRRQGTVPASTASAQPPAAPVVAPLTVKGIVKFPGGAAAIVNDQIVKVGDIVEGNRVEHIADGRVVLHEPGGGLRTIPLAGFSSIPPAPLMGK